MKLRDFPDYTGLHIRDEAPGALRNGTRIRKIKSKPNDTHQNGELATVLGSVCHPQMGYGYFVEWDSHPQHAVFIMGNRCRVAD